MNADWEIGRRKVYLFESMVLTTRNNEEKKQMKRKQRLKKSQVKFKK